MDRESISKIQTSKHIAKDGDTERKESNICNKSSSTHANIEELAKEWKAKIGIHGKSLISNKREMTRKEFLDLRKSFKTCDEFMDHPLLFVMFRSENQINPAFPHWCEDVIKYIKSNNKEKE